MLNVIWQKWDILFTDKMEIRKYRKYYYPYLWRICLLYFGWICCVSVYGVLPFCHFFLRTISCCKKILGSTVAWGAFTLSTLKNLSSWKLFVVHFNLFPIQFIFPGKICRHIARKSCQLHHSFIALRQDSPRGYYQCVAWITKLVLGVHANSTVY